MAGTDDDPARDLIRSADELVAEVCAELRRLAASLTGKLPAGQTIQPTALVHEAYMRLVRNQDPGWDGRRHFFGAAAQAMREILIEQARRKDSLKRGGGARRIELSEGLALVEALFHPQPMHVDATCAVGGRLPPCLWPQPKAGKANQG